MEFHQLRYFVAVARVLNFTRAAENCNVSQPTLTRAVQKLEDEFGGNLIHRERLLTQLTDIGKLVLPLLENSLAAAEQARNKAKQFGSRKLALLRIGLAPSISASIMTEPLSELARCIPGLQIYLTENNSQPLIDALLEGDIHAAIVESVENLPDRIDRWRLFEERYLTVVARHHPFAQLDKIPVSALHDAVWLASEDCDVGKLFEQTCFQPGVVPVIDHWGREQSHLQYMAAAGLGAMLTPEYAPRLSALVARPIEGDPVRRHVELLVVAGRRYAPALHALVKTARLRDWQRGFEPKDSDAVIDPGHSHVA